jgi:hypothetical protein
MWNRAGFPKPFEIHVYYGSSFNQNEKWVCKGYEELYGFFPTQSAAVKKAREVAKTFLFPQFIWIFQFGELKKRTRLLITRG